MNYYNFRTENVSIKEWINPIYFDEESQAQIQEQFESDSQISLGEFLKEEKFTELVDAVNKSTGWLVAGPPNQQFYNYQTDPQEPIIRDFLKLLKSEELSNLLTKLTCLVPTQQHCELQCFKNNNYTLMHDGDSRRTYAALDCIFYLITNPIWDDQWGGFQSYHDNSGELLTVEPAKNSLALVFCNEETSRFTKFVNHTAPVPLYNVYLLLKEDQ